MQMERSQRPTMRGKAGKMLSHRCLSFRTEGQHLTATDQHEQALTETPYGSSNNTRPPQS